MKRQQNCVNTSPKFSRKFMRPEQLLKAVLQHFRTLSMKANKARHNEVRKEYWSYPSTPDHLVAKWETSKQDAFHPEQKFLSSLVMEVATGLSPMVFLAQNES